jgi:dipeptidyl aminopeptidase/acylaminoacyl peptidase
VLRAPGASIARIAVVLAILVALPLAASRVAAAPAAKPGARTAILLVDGTGASAMLPDGSGVAAVPWLQPGDRDLAVSPSGRRLAFSSDRDGNRELYVADLVTGALARLTRSSRREDVEPAWSPDGSQLVWAAGTATGHDLYRARIDGTGGTVRLTRGAADDREPAWSPDGRTIAFASNELGAFDLWTVSPRGTARATLVDAPGDARVPDWHPSGTRLAYTEIVDGAADVWVASLDGTTRPLIASSAYDGHPDWAPDGTSLAFLRGRGTLEPWSAHTGGRAPARIARTPRGAVELVFGRLGAELAPSGAAQLPDLDQRAPSDVVVRAAGAGYVLGFTSATDNLGDGPVWLRAGRSSPREPMLVTQQVQHDGGRVATLPGVGELRYELHPPHRHWHLDDFVRYELRTLDGRAVVRDRKSGFCLLDRWGLARRVQGARRALPRFVEDCATLQPRALRVEQGTSAGYTDRYPAFFHGQDLPLTGLPAGLYLLVQTANPERRLRELDYANNASSALVRLRWPAGSRSAPQVDVLRRCARSERCVPAPAG